MRQPHPHPPHRQPTELCTEKHGINNVDLNTPSTSLFFHEDDRRSPSSRKRSRHIEQSHPLMPQFQPQYTKMRRRAKSITGSASSVVPRGTAGINKWVLMAVFFTAQTSNQLSILFPGPILFVNASRAYPHGCMYRHPSYYTYDEREDISWADAVSINDGFDTGHLGGQMMGNPMGHMTDSFHATDNSNHNIANTAGDATDGGFPVGYGTMEMGVHLHENNLGSISDAGGGALNPMMGGRNRIVGGHESLTSSNDFYGVQSAMPYADFRFLPPKSSPLRRPYERYRLTRRLGAGKFSDVFEAVDVVWEEARKKEIRRKRRKRRRKARLSNRELGGDRQDLAETTEEDTSEEEKEEWRREEEVDPRSLVVLKCLKPISERKIRRELLVLTHCATLPNLARLIGIVIPNSMDKDEENEVGNTSIQQSVDQRRSSNQNYEKEDTSKSKANGNCGSVQKKSPSLMDNINSGNTATQKNKHDENQLPALVLEHAGRQSQWFCHGPRPSSKPTTQKQRLSSNAPGEDDSDFLSEYEMKYYLCHLLVALDGLHAAGIMHRDVKPRNCLINHFNYRAWETKAQNNVGDSTRKDSATLSQELSSISQETPHPLPPPPLMLVDLGLADFYLPGKEYNVRVASRHYKSPELLIGFKYYDYGIDMWSVGCILAGLLFRREPFFRGKDNEDQLGKIVSVLGTRDFLPYYRKCNVRLSSKARAAIGKYCSASSSSSSSSEDGQTSTTADVGRRMPWLSFLSPSCPIPSPEALDLLDRLLVYDHEQRWTAREALSHAWFDDVREEVWREVQERMLWESQWRSVVMHRR